MSMASLEKEIVAEASGIAKRKLKKKDMMEWSTSPIKEVAGEFIIHCPTLGVYAAFKGAK